MRILLGAPETLHRGKFAGRVWAGVATVPASWRSGLGVRRQAPMSPCMSLMSSSVQEAGILKSGNDRKDAYLFLEIERIFAFQFP